jgi:hypothetical protein
MFLFTDAAAAPTSAINWEMAPGLSLDPVGAERTIVVAALARYRMLDIQEV